MKKSPQKTRDMAYIGLFAVLITICSWIAIPTAVPFTLQTFGVFLTCEILGGQRATWAILVYIMLGIVGMPVFSGFAGGIGILLGNTGGYIVGFLGTTMMMWMLEKWAKKSALRQMLAMLAGLLVCYGIGTMWFRVLYIQNTGSVGWMAVLSWCVLPFVVPDLIKMAAALLIAKRLLPVIKMTLK